jgi:hypothetical protein
MRSPFPVLLSCHCLKEDIHMLLETLKYVLQSEGFLLCISFHPLKDLSLYEISYSVSILV